MRPDDRIIRALRSLPARVPPPALRTKLLVLASRELQRRRLGRWQRWTVGLRDNAQNMMRPLALPLAGGVFSAIVLFSTFFGSTYPLQAPRNADVPTILTTEAAVKSTS